MILIFFPRSRSSPKPKIKINKDHDLFGFFHKIKLSDIFVVLDNVQYAKGSNRNKIITSKGWTWITVPINKTHKFSRSSEVEINNEIDWSSLHWAKIRTSYANAKHFHLYKEYFEKLYKRNWKMLFELNFETTKKIVEWLGIKTKFVRESELKIKGHKFIIHKPFYIASIIINL